MHLASLYTSFGYNHTKFILLFNGLLHLTQCFQVSCICQNTLSFKGKWNFVLYTYLVCNYFKYNLNTHKRKVFNNSIIYNFGRLKRCNCTSMRAYIKRIWSINILKFHTDNFNTPIYLFSVYAYLWILECTWMDEYHILCRGQKVACETRTLLPCGLWNHTGVGGLVSNIFIHLILLQRIFLSSYKHWELLIIYCLDNKIGAMIWMN